MHDDSTLLPPIGEINKRLTVIARQQHRLRTLLKLAVEAREDAQRFGMVPSDRQEAAAPQPEAVRPEGVTLA
jgi:hypothetical protein